jgi:hypothetical protein
MHEAKIDEALARRSHHRASASRVLVGGVGRACVRVRVCLGVRVCAHSL